MILEIAQLIIGLLFFLYLPGFFVTELFFKDRKKLEKVLLAIILSIMIGLSIGVFFGYDRAQALRTGGFTQGNIWVAELIATAALSIALIIKINFIDYHFHKNKKEFKRWRRSHPKLKN